MKIVSDFDGVWTHPRREAETMMDIIREELAAATGLDLEGIRRRLVPVEQELRTRPENHGWKVKGALTAYADEDPFCWNGGLVAALMPTELGEAIRRKFTDGDSFANHCYRASVARVEQTHRPQMIEGAARLARRFLAAKAEIVVVSNSSPEKLTTWFRHAGISGVRVRGHAAKFELDGSPEIRTIAGRDVRLDRPRYRAALLEERPDFVMGDVFSIDLALPASLGLETVLIENPYTPDWSRRAVAATPGARCVSSLEDVVLHLEVNHARAQA